jgi:hypothetical protein
MPKYSEAGEVVNFYGQVKRLQVTQRRTVGDIQYGTATVNGKWYKISRLPGARMWSTVGEKK